MGGRSAVGSTRSAVSTLSSRTAASPSLRSCPGWQRRRSSKEVKQPSSDRSGHRGSMTPPPASRPRPTSSFSADRPDHSSPEDLAPQPGAERPAVLPGQPMQFLDSTYRLDPFAHGDAIISPAGEDSSDVALVQPL